MPLLSWVNTTRRIFQNKLLRFLLRRRVSSSDHVASIEKLQTLIGYRFRSEALLKHALTHKSAIDQEDTKGLLSNERLEFLGDAVLNCLVTEHLYLHHPEKSEGQLSKIKSLVVSRKILGDVACTIDLGHYLIFGISEEKSGGRDRASTMSNAFEAIIGAVYLDGGLEHVKVFLEKFLFKRIPEFLQDERNVNYKSKILELSQRDGFGMPKYTTIEAIGPDHAKKFRVQIEIAGIPCGEGCGTNKKNAQQLAAQQAVEQYNKVYITTRCKGEIDNELVSN
ncbi:ribonuclease III [bacterium]|nr:ribonuclease III [candidate division CSSED10-310 bacterium]